MRLGIIEIMRTAISLVLGVAVLVGGWLVRDGRAQAPERSALAGAWVRNHELSDPPPARTTAERGDRGDRGGFGRGGRRGGGFGGGRYGGAGRGRMGGDPQEMARMRDALRDIMQPGERLTITQTDSIVVITGEDGRTTRLAPDGKKVKDENTRIERKTRWEGGQLVSDVSGAGPGKITQTFSIDADSKRLRIAIQIVGRDDQKRTITHVYDSES